MFDKYLSARKHPYQWKYDERMLFHTRKHTYWDSRRWRCWRGKFHLKNCAHWWSNVIQWHQTHLFIAITFENPLHHLIHEVLSNQGKWWVRVAWLLLQSNEWTRFLRRCRIRSLQNSRWTVFHSREVHLVASTTKIVLLVANHRLRSGCNRDDGRARAREEKHWIYSINFLHD